MYLLLVIDDFSRMCWVFFLKIKVEAFECFQKLHILMERQTVKKLKMLVIDRGGEFSLSEFLKYCEDLGVRREFIAPYTTQQNSVAKKKNRTVVEIEHSLLKNKDLTTYFYGEEISITIYLINRSPT